MNMKARWALAIYKVSKTTKGHTGNLTCGRLRLKASLIQACKWYIYFIFVFSIVTFARIRFFTLCNKGKASLYPLLNLELLESGEPLPPLQSGWKCWLTDRSYTVYMYTCQLFLSKSACDFCILNARISDKNPFQCTKTFRWLPKTAEDVPMNFENCRIQ